MALIPIEDATRVAADRIVRVLREEFANKLALDAAEAGIQAQPAPEPYHIFRGNAVDVEEVILNADVWVNVDAPSGYSSSRRRGSAGPDRYCQFIETDFEVVLLFREVIQELPALVDRPDGSEPSALERRQLNLELMQLRADVYAGALMHTILRYVQGGAAITDVDLVTGGGNLFRNATDDLFGVAQVTITTTQKVGVPNKAPLPSDQ